MSFSQVIRQGCSTWNIPLPEEAVEQLEQYSQLLLEKNQVMNLTAITEPEQVALRHMLDCLYQMKCVDFAGKQVVDVDRRDGVKFYLEGDAWVMMRPSGTEPLVRIYAEAETVDEVHDLLKAAESVVVS